MEGGYRGLKTVKLSDGEDTLSVNLWQNVDCEGIAVEDAVKVSALEVMKEGLLTSSPSTKVSVSSIDILYSIWKVY